MGVKRHELDEAQWSRIAPLLPGKAWEKVFADLVEDRDNQYLMLDSTLVRAHQQATTGRGAAQKRGPRSGCGAFPRRTDDQGPHGLRHARTAGPIPDRTRAKP